MNDKVRSEFEAFASSCGLNTAIAGGLYRSQIVCRMWQAWLAAKAKYEPRWLPIETAPTDGTWILAINAESNPGRQHVVRHSMGSSVVRPWKTGSGFLEWVAGITHWMPLPSAPSTQGGGE